jgi:diguanylate cyclase (GGDEF)-like protein
VALLLVNQFVIYGVAWALAALLIRDERPSIALWSAYCLLQAGGLYWMVTVGPARGGIAPAAAMLTVFAYACADLGIDRFINRRVRFFSLWCLLLALGEGFQIANALADLPPAVGAVGYNLSVAALLLGPLIALRPALWREFGAWGWVPLVPGGLVCALALLRCGMIVADPSIINQPRAPLVDNRPLLLATLFAAGAFNVSFLGLVIGRLVARLRSLLHTDALTGLANRSGLEKQLGVAWATSRRHGGGLSVAFIDIDRFKGINDLGGHEAGDRIIKGVADLLMHNARINDHVGRWGGDEFVVVMPHTGADEAAQAMQRLRERVRAARFAVPAGCEDLSLSIGIATQRDEDRSVQDLVTRADAAMYGIKRGLTPGLPASPVRGEAEPA